MIRILNESSFNESHVLHITCSCFQDTVSLFDCEIAYEPYSAVLLHFCSREPSPNLIKRLTSRGTLTSRDTAFTNLYYSQYIVNVSKLLFSIGNRSWCDRAWAMLEIFDEDFIIYAFCVLNIEIYLKLPRLKIRFQIKFIASPTTVSNAIRNS